MLAYPAITLPHLHQFPDVVVEGCLLCSGCLKELAAGELSFLFQYGKNALLEFWEYGFFVLWKIFPGPEEFPVPCCSAPEVALPEQDREVIDRGSGADAQ